MRKISMKAESGELWVTGKHSGCGSLFSEKAATAFLFDLSC